MSEHEEVHIEADGMLFLAVYIEDQLDLIQMIDQSGHLAGVSALTDGVADVAREQIAEAQAALDALIAEDTTWRPA